MRRHVCIALTILVTYAALALSGGAPARAQNTSDKAAAEALFDRGLSLMREGKYEEACQRLEQSQSIERGIGTMLYLAECYEKLGRTASAWALFREASSLAQAQGQLERAEAGKRRAEKLEKSLSRLVVIVPAESRVAGLSISDNGAPMAQGAWGIALPVDPGLHRIEASAPGYLRWSSEVRIGTQASQSELRVPALEVDPDAQVASGPPEPALQSASPQRAAATSPAGQPAEPQGMSTQRIVGLAISGAGVLAIAAGAITGGLAIKKNNDSKDLTDAAGCTSRTCETDSEKAVHLANASTALWSVGGALVVGGLVTYLLGLKQDKRRTDVALGVSRGGASVRVGGVF